MHQDFYLVVSDSPSPHLQILILYSNWLLKGFTYYKDASSNYLVFFCHYMQIFWSLETKESEKYVQLVVRMWSTSVFYFTSRKNLLNFQKRITLYFFIIGNIEASYSFMFTIISKITHTPLDLHLFYTTKKFVWDWKWDRHRWIENKTMEKLLIFTNIMAVCLFLLF